MKKVILFIFVVFLCKNINSQSLVITQSGFEPAIGDISKEVPLDTSAYTSGMPNFTTGSGVTWDFSNLGVTGTVITSNYVDPSTLTVTVPNGATLAQNRTGSYNFYKSVTTPTTQFEILSIKIGTLGLTFANSGIVAKYPISYGTGFSDNISGTVDFTTGVTFSGNIATVADGEGTLLMPQSNSYSNVLRVTCVQNITVTAFIFPIANVEQTTYSYYHSSSKFPILTVTQAKTTFSSQTTVNTTATGNADFLVIGIDEHKSDNLTFKAFPNPSNNLVNFYIGNNEIPESVSVSNILGEIVLEEQNTKTISIENLKPGIYTVTLRQGNKTGRQQIIKQ